MFVLHALIEFWRHLARDVCLEQRLDLVEAEALVAQDGSHLRERSFGSQVKTTNDSSVLELKGCAVLVQVDARLVALRDVDDGNASLDGVSDRRDEHFVAVRTVAGAECEKDNARNVGFEDSLDELAADAGIEVQDGHIRVDVAKDRERLGWGLADKLMSQIHAVQSR